MSWRDVSVAYIELVPHGGVQLFDRGHLMIGGKVGIPERHVDITMPHQIANGHQIDAGHRQVTGEGMP